MSSPNDLQSTNRRTFIRSLIGLGASATAASLFTKEALADVDYDPATQVPRIHGYRRTNVEEIRRTGAPPEYEPIYATIPRTKWEDVEAAHDARRRAEAALSDLEPAPRVAVGWGSSRGKPQRQVVVKHVTERRDHRTDRRRPDLPFEEFADTVKDRLPDELVGKAGRGTAAETTLESIQVRTAKRRVVTQQQDYHYDYEYRSNGVPSGCLISHDDGEATLGPFLFDVNSNEWVFLTAGHVANSSPDGKFYQNDATSWGDDYFADVNYSKVVQEDDFDVAVLHNLEFSGTWEFAADSWNRYQGPSIEGMQSKSGLKDMDYSDTIYKQGISTGRSEGFVSDVSRTDFEAWMSNERGDSGGPYWVENGSDEALISGVHFHGGPDDDDVVATGTIMEAIVDRFNLSSL